jgi:hypothetical protein
MTENKKPKEAKKTEEKKTKYRSKSKVHKFLAEGHLDVVAEVHTKTLLKGRPSKYREEFCDMLIEHMKKGLSYESFASDAGVCFDTLYEWEKVHSNFSDSKKRGNSFRMKTVETLLLKASAGQLEKANMTGIIFLLKNAFPKQYKDRHDHEINAKVETTQELSEIGLSKIANIFLKNKKEE